jgi:hypothetical protein
MSVDLTRCTEEQLWRLVASHLEKAGIPVVLVGGAVVSIYSNGAYRSGDLDFVRTTLVSPDVGTAMAQIGFRREGRHFIHPDCRHLFVDFVSGPLGIGEQTHVVPDEIPEGGVRIKLLSPTDSVCDRLASYIHYSSRDALDQAALVARAQPVDWAKIERWCRGERALGAYADLQRLVKQG